MAAAEIAALLPGNPELVKVPSDKSGVVRNTKIQYSRSPLSSHNRIDMCGILNIDHNNVNKHRKLHCKINLKYTAYNGGKRGEIYQK